MTILKIRGVKITPEFVTLTVFALFLTQPVNGQGGGKGFGEPLLDYFGLKFLILDQLRNAFAQLFLNNEHIT